MASANAAAGPKILELESIRGLAALVVFLQHIPAWNESVHDLAIMRNGYLMVELFFVLSGYVIYRSYGERIRNAADVAHFQFLRFGRLYPVHLAVLLGFLLAETAKYFAQQRLGIAFGRPAFEHYSLENVVANLTLTHAIGLFSNLPAINGPSWSISVEFYVYLMFALIGAYLTRVRAAVYAVLALGATIALIVITGDNETQGRFDDLFRGIAGFFLGCLLAIGSVRLEKSEYTVPGWGLALSALAVVAFVVLKPAHRQVDVLIFPLTMALIFATVHGTQGPLKSLLNWRPIVWLGTISYSVYMLHALIVWCFNNGLRHVFKVAGDGAQLPTGVAFTAYGATIAATLLASTLAYHMIEKPWRERSRRFVKRLEAARG